MTGLWLGTYVVLWVLALSMAVVLIGVARQVALLHTRLGSRGSVFDRDVYGLPRGVTAPLGLEGKEAVTGHPTRLDSFRGRELVLVFVRPSCTPCDELVTELRASNFIELQPTLVITFPDTVGNEISFIGDQAIDSKLIEIIDTEGEIAREFAVELVPFVYLIDSTGRVAARGIANTASQIEVLLETQRPRALFHSHRTGGENDYREDAQTVHQVGS